MQTYLKISVITLFFILGVVSLAFCAEDEGETFTITTYYPSPYGSYTELTTYSNTYLATGSGRVGIGTSSPGQKLSVAGTIESTSGGIKFPDGSTQTAAGITGVTAGTGLTGGGTSGNVTLDLASTAKNTYAEGSGWVGDFKTETIATGNWKDCPSGQYVCGVRMVDCYNISTCGASHAAALQVKCCGK